MQYQPINIIEQLEYLFTKCHQETDNGIFSIINIDQDKNKTSSRTGCMHTRTLYKVT